MEGGSVMVSFAVLNLSAINIIIKLLKKFSGKLHAIIYVF